MAYLIALMFVLHVPLLQDSDKAIDFTGKWRLQKLSTSGTRGGPDNAAETLVIHQTTAELRLEFRWTYDQEHAPVVQVFSLDGSENRNPSDNGEGELRSRCRWHAGALEIQGTELMSIPIAFKRTFSLRSDRDELTMKTVRSNSSRTWSHRRIFVKS